VEGYRDLWARGCREFEIVACCDPVVEEAEARAGEIQAFQGTRPLVYASLDDLMAAGGFVAADLCLAHFLHHQVAVRMLDAGIHVSVEKPVGLSVRATRRIMAAAERTGLVVSCAENVRRYLTARACAWAVRDRKLLGDVRTVVVHTVNDGLFDYGLPMFKWRGINVLTGGGMIMDSGAHFADMMQVLFGTPDEVTCSFSVQDRRLIQGAPVVGDHPADVEDAWQALIRFASGVDVTWVYNRGAVGEQRFFSIFCGTEGTMTDLGYPLHPFQGGGQAVLRDGTVFSSDDLQRLYRETLSEEESERLFPYGAVDGFSIELLDFVRAVATGRRPEMDAGDALQAKSICEACYESAVAGRAVKVADVIDGKVREFQRPIDEYWGL
jgi:predicted dehydrogenase